jgi:hypothetical protein
MEACRRIFTETRMVSMYLFSELHTCDYSTQNDLPQLTSEFHKIHDPTSDEAYICTRVSGNYESEFAKCSDVDSKFIRNLSAILITRTCLQALYHVGMNHIIKYS